MAETSVQGILGRLDNASDRLSPIVVKEVRQIVRTREFVYSFAISLIAGLTIAAVGGTNAANGDTTSGAGIFEWLTSCLTLIGFVVVPIGTFMALRNERLERTFDLIMLTSLAPRRIVIGKIMAQGVKLLTLFAGVAPFMAMSFLLGGIDLATILLTLAVLFLWSLWACSVCLFLSSAAKTKTMSGVMLGVMGLCYLLVLNIGGGGLGYFLRAGLYGGGYYGGGYYGGRRYSFWEMMFSGAGSEMWWTLAVSTSICLITMTNLILLAENCLALEDEDRTPALRIGLLVQFLMVIAWLTIPPLFVPAVRTAIPAAVRFNMLSGLCGAQLMFEAFFMATGSLTLSRRMLLRDKPTRWFRRLTVVFRPGGGRAVAYVLVQIALLLFFGAVLTPDAKSFRWLLAFCGYICFFTGVPSYAVRLIAPRRVTPGWLRLSVLVALLVALVATELTQYFGASAAQMNHARHVINPMAALGDWDVVERNSWQWQVIVMGAVGLLAYVRLIFMGRQKSAPPPVKAASAHAG